MRNRFLDVDRKANRSRRVSGIALCCLLLMAICLACASLTYGSYVKEEQRSLSASVAVMRVRVNSQNSSLTLNNLNTTAGTISFAVYRTDTNSNTTEVSFTYSLSLELPEGSTFPDYLAFSLSEVAETDEEGSETGSETDEEGSAAAAATPVAGTAAADKSRIVFARDYIFRANDSATEKAFTLTITVTDLFSVPQDGITLSGLAIIVHAEQIQEGA